MSKTPALAGSAAPMDSSKGKWHDEVDSKALAKLNEIRADIDAVTDDTILTIARARLRLGNLLAQARELLPGDRQFGQWRKDVLPDIPARTANTYLNMAKTFKNAPEMVEQLGWSNARLAMSADLPEITGPEALPEVQEAIEAKKKPDVPTPAPAPEDEGEPPAVKPDPQPTQPSEKDGTPWVDLDVKIAKILQEPVKVRIAAINDGEFNMIDEISQFCIAYGFGPELAERRINPSTWNAITTYTESRVESGSEDDEFLALAAKRIEDHWRVS